MKAARAYCITSAMTGSLSTLPPKSLEGVREQSLWVHSANLAAHTHLHTPTDSWTAEFFFLNDLVLFAIFHIMSISDNLPRKGLKISHFNILYVALEIILVKSITC